MLRLALLLLLLALVSGNLEVQSIDAVPVFAGTSPEDTLQNYDQARVEAGVNVPRMPGPRYGNPGYKESHSWEKAVDVLSPVVFDVTYYMAKYKLETREAARLDWQTRLAKDAVPECRIGSAAFSVNDFGSSKKAQGKNCGDVLAQYLEAGLFEGDLSGTTMFSFLHHGKNEFVPEKGLSLGKLRKVAETYTWTYWFRQDAKADTKARSVLRYGGPDGANEAYPRSPAIFIAPAGGGALSRFSYDRPDTNDCPNGSVDKAQCTEFAKAVGAKNDGKLCEGICEVKSWDSSPKGCVYQKGGENAGWVGFNDHKEGKARDIYSPVCAATGTANGPPQMQFVVSQNNDADFGCTPSTPLQLGKWYFVALAVNTNTIKVSFNGEAQCDATNNEGRALLLKADGDVFAGETLSEPANGRIRSVSFYDQMLTDEEIKQQMQKDPPEEQTTSTSAP